MNAAPWTHKEIAFLKANYLLMSRGAIGAALGGRGPEAVGEKARRLGVARRHFRAGDEALETIRRLTEAGRSEAEIAAALGTNRPTVRKYRRRLGVAPPANGRSAHYRRRVAAMTKEQCRAEGVSALIEIRHLTQRVRAATLGYPPEVGLVGLRVMEALKTLGPSTAKEVAAAVGISHVKAGTWEHLEALGLVTIARYARKVEGSPGPRRHVYRLATAGGDPRKAAIGRAIPPGDLS